MLWWDWTWRQRLALSVAILIVAATPWLIFGFWPHSSYNLGVLAGGTAFLAIPQIFAWFLFVGLRTGRIPIRFGSECRTESPAWFWTASAIYVVILVLFALMIGAIIFDVPLPRS